MKQSQCPRFHLYHQPDPDTGGCPVCAAQALDLTRTRSLFAGADGLVDTATTVAAPFDSAPGRGQPAAGHSLSSVDPVVGWLACVAGPERGRDWRLVCGPNSLGRGEGADVRLAADPAVSRERHAVIDFDPRHSRFTLAPGGGRGLVSCNGLQVLAEQPLAAHDRIALGGTTLVFVPLVGQRFSWVGA